MYKDLILSKNNVVKNNILSAYKKKEPILGEFAGIFKYKKNYIIYRDHIGCRKFFFIFKKKKLYSSSNFIDLIKYGEDSIQSAEPGYYIEIRNNGEFVKKTQIPKYIISEKRTKNIEEYLKFIKKNYGKSCIVCLSGGLDSTIIAYYAKKIFHNVSLITAYFDNEFSSVNSDYISSKKIGNFLNLKHFFVKIDDSVISKNLKKIMYACQDWRDYNLHCSCLNFTLGEFIKKNTNLKNRVILTGDFMNEFVADYTSEKVFGKVFYRVPNLPKKTLQRFFTSGLDTSSREIGIFGFFDLQVFQPFNCLKDFYFKFNEKKISQKNFKYNINKTLIPKNLFNLVNKKKVRAQIGDEKSGGIIKIFHKKKIYQKELEKIFVGNFNCSSKWLRSFIQFGRFKY